jgi:hypothetical protein
LLVTRQAEHENGQHERVVRAEQSFKHDKEADGNEI